MNYEDRAPLIPKTNVWHKDKEESKTTQPDVDGVL